jgi:pseudouridine synthase
LEDGVTGPAKARLIERAPGGTLIEITLSEGRNRQIRRMLESVGHPVRRLVRTAIGPLMLGRLKPATYRRLRPEEVRELYRAAGL